MPPATSVAAHGQPSMRYFPMLACVDVAYREGQARAACLVFPHWRSAEPIRVLKAALDQVADYEPGAFCKRELPGLLAVLDQVAVHLEGVVIDGYVWLADGTVPGLGAHLYEALRGRSAVVGVAKSSYRDDCCSLPVLRGSSRRPLFVTAAGFTPKAAAEAVRAMHGDGRIPTLLRRADRACRW
jgi:deoxyribonuclease V